MDDVYVDFFDSMEEDEVHLYEDASHFDDSESIESDEQMDVDAVEEEDGVDDSARMDVDERPAVDAMAAVDTGGIDVGSEDIGRQEDYTMPCEESNDENATWENVVLEEKDASRADDDSREEACHLPGDENDYDIGSERGGIDFDTEEERDPISSMADGEPVGIEEEYNKCPAVDAGKSNGGRIFDSGEKVAQMGGRDEALEEGMHMDNGSDQIDIRAGPETAVVGTNEGDTSSAVAAEGHPCKRRKGAEEDSSACSSGRRRMKEGDNIISGDGAPSSALCPRNIIASGNVPLPPQTHPEHSFLPIRLALQKLTVPVLKSKLDVEFGINGTNRKEVKRMRKAELIDLLLTAMEKEEKEDGAGKSILLCLLLY